MHYLLIEPVWNRNKPYPHPQNQTTLAFNRTSMESKQCSVCDPSFHGFPFNRTSMESKPELEPLDTEFEAAFNRTSMESKHK